MESRHGEGQTDKQMTRDISCNLMKHSNHRAFHQTAQTTWPGAGGGGGGGGRKEEGSLSFPMMDRIHASHPTWDFHVCS